MNKISQEIAKGNFRHKLEIRSNDEIGELSHALNKMSKVLENKIKEISEDKAKMETVLTSVIEGIAAIDKNGKVILYNDAFESIIQFPSHKAIGKYHWEIIRNNTINELIKNALKKGQRITQEIMILFPQERTFKASVTPLEGEGTILGIVVVLNDITEIKKLERIRSEFVANVSHELRTPLTSIQGFIETIKGDKIGDPIKLKRFLKIIERQSNRLNNLIEDLLHLSKIESREVKMNFQDINLEELIKKIVSELKEKIDKKQHKICLNISSRLPLVNADYENIELVISNLLNNAIHYTPEKGKISISASERIQDVYIEVSDNGIGIAAEHLPRVFERFYRINKDRSREYGGTGLGLAIVKHIIKAHQGMVGVESHLGRGTSFYFTLPKSKKSKK
jgi:two-component system phosphate regulon sensor histidine kinase PhoR